MESNYKLLDHKESLTVNEIEKQYNDCWIFLVKAQYDSNDHLIGGIPVICGDVAYAGAEDGIYDKYDADEYGEQDELYLFKPGFISALEIVEHTNA